MADAASKLRAMLYMSTPVAIVCTAIVVLAFSQHGEGGWVTALCVVPGVWLLWLLDIAKSAVTPRREPAPQVCAPCTPGPQANVAAHSRFVFAPPSKFPSAAPSARPPSSDPKSEQVPAGTSSHSKGRQTTSAAQLPADHFRRHIGLPGYLYIARNDEHRTGLYKLGYTTQSAVERVASLNLELRRACDIGSFRLVHSAAASAAYDAEQIGFELLSDFRLTEGREFFLAPEELLIDGVNAAGAQSQGDFRQTDEFLNQARDIGPDITSLRQEDPHTAVEPARGHPNGGWILIARNECHRANTFRIGYTAGDPAKRLHRLNAVQRRLPPVPI